VPAGELFGFPPGVLFGAVVVAASRVAVAQAGPAAGLVRGVVFEIAALRGAAAARPGARGVPDLGQVPEHDPGVVARGLMPVIAVAGRDRAEGEEQVPRLSALLIART
jgi:hypothetical protein